MVENLIVSITSAGSLVTTIEFHYCHLIHNFYQTLISQINSDYNEGKRESLTSKTIKVNLPSP